MTKENFVKLVESMQVFDTYIDTLYSAFNINIIDSELYNSPYSMLEPCLQTIFNEAGKDYFDWWMWESSDRIIKVDGKELDVNEPEDFYDFLVDINGFNL